MTTTSSASEPRLGPGGLLRRELRGSRSGDDAHPNVTAFNARENVAADDDASPPGPFGIVGKQRQREYFDHIKMRVTRSQRKTSRRGVPPLLLRDI